MPTITQAAAEHNQTPIFLRTKDEITAFFDGLELTAPGVTDINAWENPAYQPARTIGYGGTARKNDGQVRRDRCGETVDT